MPGKESIFVRGIAFFWGCKKMMSFCACTQVAAPQRVVKNINNIFTKYRTSESKKLFCTKIKTW